MVVGITRELPNAIIDRKTTICIIVQPFFSSKVQRSTEVEDVSRNKGDIDLLA
jgi:hypothetical protein